MVIDRILSGCEIIYAFGQALLNCMETAVQYELHFGIELQVNWVACMLDVLLYFVSLAFCVV